MGRPLSPPEIHQKTYEHCVNSTKKLLNAGRGHQAPRKAAHFLRKEVGNNIKEEKKKRKKQKGRDGDLSQEGSL